MLHILQVQISYRFFLCCRRSFLPICSSPFFFPPSCTVCINYPTPLDALLISLFSSAFSFVPLSSYSIFCFSNCLHRIIIKLSLELLIDLFSHSVLPLIFSFLYVSPTHHYLNKPALLPSHSIMNRFSRRASMFFFFFPAFLECHKQCQD